MSDHSPRGRYTRGYLPHYDTDERPQMSTYRLADALPRDVALELVERHRDDDERRAKFEELLDRGYGSCVLREPRFAEIVIENWKHHDGVKYRLLDWVVMPNHAHVTYDRPVVSMEEIVHSWKSYTSNRIKGLLGTLGDGEPLWLVEYFDRFSRDRFHWFNMVNYIWLNPVKAGLVDDPFDWPWSSIHEHEALKDSIMRWWERSKDRFWEMWRS